MKHCFRHVETVTAWLAALAFGFLCLLGCGPDGSISLPNGYELLVLNADDRLITGPGEGIPHDEDQSVGEFGWHGDIIYGTLVDRETQQPEGYFIVDTQAGSSRAFDSRESWEDALRALDEDSIELHWPSLGPFNPMIRGKVMFWIRVTFAVVAVGIAFWIYRAARKFRSRGETFGLE